MKLAMRNWRWLAGFLALGMICATYLLAQTQATPASVNAQATGAGAVKLAKPTKQEAADAASLIDAVNSGDVQAALEILRAYGVAESTLLAMAPKLGKLPAPVELGEPFLKVSLGALSVGDWTTRTNLHANLHNFITAHGYERPVWIPHRQDTTPLASYSADLLQMPSASTVQLDIKPNDAGFIRWFIWCDRYADYMHSVSLNGANLSNTRLNEASYGRANRTLNALFQLIKARKPDVFVWLGVVKQDNLADEKWLRAMTFRPDGLQIWNLTQFHSPFAQTRARYAKIVGTNMPMMVVDFYGYGPELQKQGDALIAALKSKDKSGAVAAMHQLGAIGGLIGQGLAEEETNLQSLGYRGISVQWPLLLALANANNATADKSNLIDPRAGVFDAYFEDKKYASMISLAADMISNSTPGDMNWAVGKLYAGMALLNQTPPNLPSGITQLDDIISFNFTNRPNRDHYIIGAVEWRIYAASIAGDTNTPRQLVQWVESQNLQRGMKANFMKKYGRLLPALPATTNQEAQ